MFEAIPINLTLFAFAYFIIFFNSTVFPELLINIKISLFVILPRSPWEQSLADTENDGVPTDDNVADVLAAIIPLFPTPQIITFDLHFKIALTLLLNESSKEFFYFFKAFIWRSITFNAILLASELIINGTKYHL